MPATALHVQVFTFGDPGDDVEVAHVSNERAQSAFLHGLIEGHLVGLGVDHARTVEGDEQAAIVLKLELGGNGAEALHRTPEEG